MGTFHTGIRIEGYPDMKRGVVIESALVDTGAELTWVPATSLRSLGIRRLKKESFTTASGRVITRDIGFAVVRLGGRFTVDEIVFAQPGDLTLLGARTLEGLGLMVDPQRKRLVAAGPAPAATAIRPELAKAMGIIVRGRATKSRAKSAKLAAAPRRPRKARS
jgi:predicted aspartyl protease